MYFAFFLVVTPSSVETSRRSIPARRVRYYVRGIMEGEVVRDFQQYRGTREFALR